MLSFPGWRSKPTLPTVGPSRQRLRPGRRNCCGAKATQMALFDVFASWVTSASGGSGHWSADRVEFWANAVGAAPPRRRVALHLAAKRPLERARKRSRPVPVTIAPPRTSAGIRHACFHHANNQDWSPCLACMLHRGSRINLYPVERQWLVPKSCILVAARLQDGWDSSLVRLIRPTRHPQSHIRPGSGPEAWAKLIQLIKQ